MNRCGIKHGFSDALCIREKGHEGLCRSKAERRADIGTVTYIEWVSRDGKFHSHMGYQTIYPRNAAKVAGVLLLLLTFTLPAHALTPIGAFALPRSVAGHSTASVSQQNVAVDPLPVADLRRLELELVALDYARLLVLQFDVVRPIVRLGRIAGVHLNPVTRAANAFSNGGHVSRDLAHVVDGLIVPGVIAGRVGDAARVAPHSTLAGLRAEEAIEPQCICLSGVVVASGLMLYQVGRNPKRGGKRPHHGCNVFGVVAVHGGIIALLLCGASANALEPVGAFLLPRSVHGASTAYSAGTLTLRTVNGQQRLFSDAGGIVYEATVPALRQKPPYLTAKVLRTWGTAYAGGQVTNLRYDSGSLWSTGGPLYDTDEFTDRCSQSLELKTGQITDHTLAIPQLWQRGGTLVCPPWFVRLTGERTAYGFGGYYSIMGGGSYGPALAIDGHQLLCFPEGHRCPRPATCWSYDHDWFFQDADLWTAADEIGGESCAASAIFTPDALMFFVSLGTGRIWYGNDGFMSGVHCEARENYIASFAGSDIANVATGKLKPWEPQPDWFYLGGQGRAAGVHYDGKLFWILFVGADPGEFESYPLVVVYGV